MASTTALALLRANVGYPDAAAVPPGMNDVLANCLDTAAARLARSGIRLGSSAEDLNLQVMYASWLFNKRKTGEGMPQMLAFEIRNRQTARAAGADA